MEPAQNLQHDSTCNFTSRGVTGKIFLRGKVIFPNFFPGVKCFFPVENFHFGTQKSLSFEKWKAKRQQTKNKKQNKKKNLNKNKRKKKPITKKNKTKQNKTKQSKTKQNKTKQNKNKTKKLLSSFAIFPPYVCNFPPSFSQFSFFSSPFFPFFIFPRRSAAISRSEVSGGHSAPFPRLLRLCLLAPFMSAFFFKMCISIFFLTHSN